MIAEMISSRLIQRSGGHLDLVQMRWARSAPRAIPIKKNPSTCAKTVGRPPVMYDTARIHSISCESEMYPTAADRKYANSEDLPSRGAPGSRVAVETEGVRVF